MKFLPGEGLRALLNTPVGKANRELIEKEIAGATAAPAVALAPLQDPQRKPLPIPALDPRKKAHGRSKGGVAIVVTIISCRRRELDEVNLVSGAKPIQDSIAASLGVDDRDRRIKWEFRQAIGEGPEGTIVRIDKAK